MLKNIQKTKKEEKSNLDLIILKFHDSSKNNKQTKNCVYRCMHKTINKENYIEV